MTSWTRTGIFWAAWAVLLGPPAQYESGGQQATPAVRVEWDANAVRTVGGETVRTILDLATGTCWRLERDGGHPGGPGRLVRIGRLEPDCKRAARGPQARGARGVIRAGAPVIRAGERIVLEEKTAVIEARLEAVALEPGWLGTAMRVRLAMGGKVLHAVVLGPGRARLSPGRGIWQ